MSDNAPHFALTPVDQAALVSLPPAERAAVALQSSVAEQQLLALVISAAGIKNVVDKNGRMEAHRAAMTLKNARVAITNNGKAVREDATAFQRAVVAEVERLTAITAVEEARLLKLRDDFDEEQKRIAEERERAAAEHAAAVERSIAAIRDLPIKLASVDAAGLTEALRHLANKPIAAEEFGDRTAEAKALVDTTAGLLVGMLEAATLREEQVRRDEEERAQRAREEQERREELERSIRAHAEKMEAQKKHEAQMAAIMEIQNLGGVIGTASMTDSALGKVRAFDPSTFGAMEPMARMARELALNTLERRLQTVLDLELPGAMEEAQAINARIDEASAEVLTLFAPPVHYGQAGIDWDEPAPLKPYVPPYLAPVMTIPTPLAKCDSAVLRAFRAVVRELRKTRPDAEIVELLNDELSVMAGA